jgi:hypothetical protein
MTLATARTLPVAATHIFPVRHHSPRSSAALLGFLDDVDPRVVLIEGPSDATDLIDVLVDPETLPPIAILGYRTDGIPGSALWPFASYSSEYVAVRWARENGRQVAFIDIPVGQALAASHNEGVRDTGDVPEEGHSPSLSQRVAEERGFRSFEEFWEASFEAPSYEPAVFRGALLAWAELVRFEHSNPLDLARDAFMAAKVEAVIEGGAPAASIAVVVGAAHAAAFVAGDVDKARIADLPPSVSSARTLIPFSFPRLAAQLGYGAGNRAPLFYQHAHDAGADYGRATLETLVAFTDHLRLRGFAASLADTIEAYRLALMLANIRGKSEPGLDEVREAAIAALTRGDAGPVNGFLWSSVVGHAVGRVASRIGRNSLQEEFWHEVDARRLPRTDEPERLILHLNNELEVATAVFLHRLRIGGIPYASWEGLRGGSGRGMASSVAHPAGGAAALQRLRETWEAQWTPATDAALVEAIVRGSTLEDVASDALDHTLAAARQSGDAAEVALQAVVASCSRIASEALSACERLAVDDTDLPSLATASRALAGLVAYGTSRKQSALGDAAVLPLLTKIFARAVVRIPDACTGTDDAVAPAKDALRTLHEIALTQPAVDRAAWIFAAHELVASYVVNAGSAGLALGLLYMAREVDDERLALLVGQRLSNRLEPVAAATFLAGFLEVNAVALVRNRAVVATLDDYLTSLPVDRFKEALPVLRRAFTVLGPTERRYLTENLVALRGIDSARAAQSVMRQGDTDALKQMNADLAKVMDDLDDML